MNKDDEMLTLIGETYQKGIDIISSKNADYASSDDPFMNFREAAQLAGVSVEQGFLVRIGDKLIRVRNLLNHDPSVKNESLEDSLLDAINYLALLKSYREMNQKEDSQPKINLEPEQITENKVEENKSFLDKLISKINK